MSCMSKLEDKLMFMGYIQSYERYRLFKLFANHMIVVQRSLDDPHNKIQNIYVKCCNEEITEQSTIDNLQEAFNERNKDFEKLKKYII